MKSLFLYEKTSRGFADKSLPGIHQISGLVGIDTNKIDKNHRLSYVRESKLREFHMRQRSLGDIIYNAKHYNINILDVELTHYDKSGLGYINEELTNAIRSKDNKKLLDIIIELNEEWDSEIEAISFSFNGQAFKLKVNGTLETDADDRVIADCPIFDNKLLAGV
ncbi:MAG: hypothetical protein ACM3PE_10055 [Deltaproteobacteria bacterium]